jgi:cell division protein FtsN
MYALRGFEIFVGTTTEVVVLVMVFYYFLGGKKSETSEPEANPQDDTNNPKKPFEKTQRQKYLTRSFRFRLRKKTPREQERRRKLI